MTDITELDEALASVTNGALAKAHETFANWLGAGYDGDALNAVLAAAAVERLTGDPLWLLVVSGSGNAKTETVQALQGAYAVITSTISSEGALLSATPAKERTNGATGGLLRKLGRRGTLVIKDVTSIISTNRDTRATIMAALREVYDGRWFRNVGTEGGRTLEWHGRIVIIGAVTTAWDRAHDVTAAMGDRFVLVRMDSNGHDIRQSAGRKAIGNTGQEIKMRQDLSYAAGKVIEDMREDVGDLEEHEIDQLLAAADLVTLARTGVDFDYRGYVIDAHAAEMPTRFAKQLTQIVRGGVAIGLDRSEALDLAIKCARDSMPPLRLAIIDDLARPGVVGRTPTDIRRYLNKPRATVDRQCQALHMLGVLNMEEVSYAGQDHYHYSLAEGIDPGALRPVTRNVSR
jgi:hypothetical protein